MASGDKHFTFRMAEFRLYCFKKFPPKRAEGFNDVR